MSVVTQLGYELGETGVRDANGVAGGGSKAGTPSFHQSVAAGDEEMQQLVRRVFVGTDETSPRTVVFCGVDAQNASSSICARVGRALAATDRGRVCLVDANLRSPRLSGMFKVALPEVAVATTSIVEQCGQIEGNLWLAGAALFSRQRTVLPPDEQLKQLLMRLRAAFDYVLMDVPGTKVCGDAQTFGSAADAAILVIEANSTHRLSARKAQQALADAGVRVLGAVLNNRSFPIPERLYRRL
jgi:Mrp family chromosome partitioning ATPase